MISQTSIQPQAPSHVQPPGSSATGENIASGTPDADGGPSTTQVAGAGILVAAMALIVTVFVAGFMRTRVERGVRHTYRRLADIADDIDVPLLLPLTIVETIREVLAGRRVMAPPSGE